MRLLPTEQEKAVNEALQIFEDNDSIELDEPCNCGSQIRHNNGGNYHEVIEVVKDQGRFFVRFDDTCEFTSPTEWEEVSEDKALNLIREKARDGYGYG